MLCTSARFVALLRLRRPGFVAVAGSAVGSKSSAGATAEEETVELLLPVNDAGGELTTGAASAAAFLSLSVSTAASRPLLDAAFGDSDGPDRFGNRGAQSVVVAQLCPCRKSINQHANATERRGHLDLQRRKRFERSAVFIPGW